MDASRNCAPGDGCESKHRTSKDFPDAPEWDGRPNLWLAYALLYFVWQILSGSAAALEPISLYRVDGRAQGISLSGQPATVIYLTGTECPLGNLYLAEIRRLASKWPADTVRFLLVNPNFGESPAAIAGHAREYGVAFEVFCDPDQALADRLGATRTPEAFVFDRQGELRYRGRVDDRYGYAHRRDRTDRADLELAIEEVLAGVPVTVPHTEVVGCLIARQRPNGANSDVTYSEVARIFQDKCESCHRSGMIAPFTLSSFDDASRWADPIREAVAAGRMPPWHAEGPPGVFANDRRLTKSEKDLLLRWIDGGMARGEQSVAPPERELASGWMIGAPDLVFAMPREVKVPAQGVVPYKYFTTRTRLTEDIWIRAAEIRPGNPAVVHHAIVFVRHPSEGMLDLTKLLDGYLVSSAPSDIPLELPPGVARRIPAGSELVWQVHYTPTGKEEVDRCELGLLLYRESTPPRGDQQTLAISNQSLRIPAGAPAYEHHAMHTLSEDITLLSLCPHMHLRGKDFTIEAIFPNKARQTLLVVKDFDPDWNTTYRLARPMDLPKGTKLHCIAHFDNSPSNPRNPGPTKVVTWGEQVWDEMMIGWIDFYRPRRETVLGN